jgi:paraquat-inducible protein B
MSKKTNPTLIGGFVVAAVVLIAGAFSLLGGSELFQQRVQYVTYFDGSVKGLRVGANVLFRGVRVGYVTDISLVGDADTLEFVTPVTIRVLPDTLTITRYGRPLGREVTETLDMEDLIAEGLRAQLGVESFVTGQLLVELDFQPDTQPVFRGINPAYQEIPSVSSSIREVFNSVQGMFTEFSESIDVRQLGRDLQSAIAGVDKLANSEDLRRVIAGLDQLVNSDDTQAVTADLRAGIEGVRIAAADTRRLISNVEDELGPIADELGSSLELLDGTLSAGQQALVAATDQIRGDSEIAVELSRTLAEVRDAARSLRVFLDYLEQNPEALLRGKQKPKD